MSKEKIIFSNVLNKTEYLRSLSLLNQVSFLTRIYSFNELVEEANIKLGLISEKPLINQASEEFMLLHALEEAEIQIPSFDDLKHFLRTIKDIRKTIIVDDELVDFENKLSSRFGENENYILIKNIYDTYLEVIKESNAIDSISLSRLLLGKGKAYDEISYIKEENISPLELELLNELSTNVKEISIKDLYPHVLFNEVKEIRPYYGNISEVDGILSDILEKGYNFSDCLIILPSKNEYPALFFEKYLELGIPFTSEIGIPISQTGAYILYKNIINLKEKYFYGVEGFKNLFKCGYFDIEKIVTDPNDIDNLIEICGRLKVSFVEETNKKAYQNLKYLNDQHHDYLVEFLKKIDIRMDAEKMILLTFNVIDAFKNGIVDILDNYFVDSHDYKNEEIKNYISFLNEKALAYIKAILIQSDDILEEHLKDSYVDSLEKQFIYPKTFDDKGIHITTVDKAISSYRKHIYFAGFSASSFPGKAEEDFLFNDEWYSIMAGKENRSLENINKKNQLFRDLVDIYSNLNTVIHLSFPSMNIVEVGGNNPASVLLEVDSRIHKDGYLNDLIKKNRYFDNKLSSLNKEVDNFLSGNITKESLPTLDIYSNETYLNKFFSPSVIGTFFDCPLRFYLEKIKYLKKEEERDLYDNIGFDTLGNLVHMAMEHFLKHQDMNEKEFKAYIEELYEAYNRFDYNPRGESAKKDDYINGCLNSYHFLKNYDLKEAKSEYEITYSDNLSIDGVKFHGSVDLLCKTKDGNYIIIDYKTGKRVKHDPKDTVSVIQGIIYALLVEQKLNVNIDKAIFYYSTVNNEVEVNVKEHLDNLHELIDVFKNALKANAWTKSETPKESCTYCSFKDVICKEGGKE